MAQPPAPTSPAQAGAGRRVPRAEAERIVLEHAQAGRLDQALAIQQRIVAAHPQDPNSHHGLAMLLLRVNRLPAAAESLQRAVALAPRQPQLLSHQGEVLRRLGRLDQAIAAGEAAHALAPDRPEVLVNLAAALLDRRDADRAIPLLQTAIQREPRQPNSHVNLGNGWRMQGRLDSAIPAYRAALALDPRQVDALSALGLCLRDQDDLAGARRQFESALAVQPQHANTLSALGILNLLEGRFVEGWRDYEARWASSEMRPRPLTIPRWRDEPLAGRHLFVFAEQGHGDTLHFCRYLPLLLRAGARVTCEVQPAMLGLLADSFPDVSFITRGDPPPVADLAIPLLSLPGQFKTDLTNLPADCPYLTVRPDVLGAWRRRLDELAPREALRVGLVWGGSRTHRTDFLRSLTPADLGALRALPDARFFSLQFGERQGEIAGWPAGADSPLIDLAPELGDFANTAGAVAALDLIVTVDTATAHLAGALARPTFVLLAKVPDWRWLLARDDSPWYPSLRLFRQAAPGDWASAVAAALQAATAQAGELIERRESERQSENP